MDRRALAWGLALFLAGAALEVGNYTNEQLAWLLFVLAALLGIYSFRDTEPVAPAFLHWPFGKLPLQVGARVAYERLRGTLWGEAAERLSRPEGEPEAILDYMATGITQEADVWGSRTPSAKLERIDRKEFGRGSIEGGGKVLRYFGSKIAYTNLMISRKDLRAAIKRMRDGAAG